MIFSYWDSQIWGVYNAIHHFQRPDFGKSGIFTGTDSLKFIFSQLKKSDSTTWSVAAVEDRGSNLKLARFHVSLPWNRDGCVPVPVPSALAAARLWLGPVKIPAIDWVLIWYCKKLWQSPFSHLYNYQMLRVWFMVQSHIPYPIWPSGIDAMLGVERWSLATSCPGQRLHCLPSVHCGQCTILCLCRDSQRWSLGADQSVRWDHDVWKMPSFL